MYGDSEPTSEEWGEICARAAELEKEREAYNSWIISRRTYHSEQGTTRIERTKVDLLELHQLSARRTCYCDIEFVQQVEELCALRWGIALKEKEQP